MKKYPNLFIPGAPKSGTSSLHDYLNCHPDIFMSSKKEPHYFSHDDRYLKNEMQYLDLFTQDKNYKFYGESSTGYFIFPNVADRIRTKSISPKFVFILRNPIDRAYSHYRWLYGLGLEIRPFYKAFLKSKSSLLDAKKSIDGKYKFYYHSSLYYKNILQYYNVFSSTNICIITTESLKSKPLESINKIFKFLKVEELANIDEIYSNKTQKIKHNKLYFYLRFINKATKKIGLNFNNTIQYIEQNKTTFSYPKMKPFIRELLKVEFEKDVKNLKKLTNNEFNEWHDFK